MPQADALRRVPPQGIVPLRTGPAEQQIPAIAIRHAARRRAETHGWDAAFTRLLGRYTRLMGRPTTLEQGILDVR